MKLIKTILIIITLGILSMFPGCHKEQPEDKGDSKVAFLSSPDIPDRAPQKEPFYFI